MLQLSLVALTLRQKWVITYFQILINDQFYFQQGNTNFAY